MNVGVYVSDSSPSVGGGYTFEQEILRSLLSLAQESDHKFVIFSRQSIKEKIPDILSNRVRNVVIPKQNILEHFLLLLRQYFFPSFPLLVRLCSKFSSFEACLRQNEIKIIFFCNPLHESVDTPYITIVWDLQHRLQPWFPEVSEKGQWSCREESYIPILQRATYIITGTQAGQQEISLFYGIPKNRIKILPHPTPGFVLNIVESNKKDLLKKYNLQNNYLLYPAQFWTHKNHANVLLALKKLRETDKIPLSLVFVGSDKNNLSYIQKMTRDLHLDEAVHFLGFVSREDLIDLYSNAFALIYPTFFGPENLPPLEAFALGCPVIASNVSGAEEQLGDAALLVDPKSPEQIANAILILYNSPDLRKTLIERGLKRAQTWTGPDFVKGIFQILDEFEGIRRCWE